LAKADGLLKPAESSCNLRETQGGLRVAKLLSNVTGGISKWAFKSIKSKILVPVTLVMALGIIGTGLWTANQVKKEANMAALEKVKGDIALAMALVDARYPGDWEIRDGKLL
jgi:hypothetical protein